MRLALYQPDIPQNVGTLLRTAACFGVGVDVIEPCGFPFSVKALQRSGMDYLDIVNVERHVSFEAFLEARAGHRLCLLTTKGAVSHIETRFQANDILMLGRESKGVPDEVHTRADVRVKIPMIPEARSLNVAISGAIVLSEALRQTSAFPAL